MSKPLRSSLVTALLLAGCGGGPRSEAQPPSWQTLESMRQLSGQRELNARVEYGAGRLEVGPAEGNLLYRFTARYNERAETPVAEYDAARNSLEVGIRRREGTRNLNGRGDEAHAALAVGPGVPTALDLKFGAGKANIELGGMSLKTLDLATGASETAVRWSAPNRIPASEVRLAAGAASLRASGLGNARAERYEFQGGVGETTLDFGGVWDRSATARLKMGMGSLTLRLPRELGVRITRSGFMTDFDAAGLTKRGEAYYSANWDTAAHKLVVEIDAAMGSINVEWTD